MPQSIDVMVYQKNLFLDGYVCQTEKNTSGSVSVQIIQKSSGKFVVKESIGVSKDPKEIEGLIIRGKERIKELQGLMELDLD